jgi:hypothetical protein
MTLHLRTFWGNRGAALGGHRAIREPLEACGPVRAHVAMQRHPKLFLFMHA